MERVSMFHNETTCDVYIGTGAGKQLMENIRTARKSVKVISPYISEGLIQELITLQKNGVRTGIITSKEDYYNSNEAQDKAIKELVKQTQTIDLKAQQERNRWLKVFNTLTYLVLFYTLAVSVLIAFFQEGEPNLFLFLPTIIFGLLSLSGTQIIKQQKIYSYRYSQTLAFKVYRRNKHSPTFIHSKIYIIDDKIAYVGSLNYTHSGTKYSVETRIKLTETEVIQKINTFFNELWENKFELKEYTINDIARDFYKEPIN